MSTAHLVIDTHDLSKGYDGVAALDGLDLQVPQNSIFGFLAPNGAGKTTAMKPLLGLSRPTMVRAGLFGLSQRPTAAPSGDGSDTRTRSAFLLSHMTARETLPSQWQVPIIAAGCWVIGLTAAAGSGARSCEWGHGLPEHQKPGPTNTSLPAAPNRRNRRNGNNDQ